MHSADPCPVIALTFPLSGPYSRAYRDELSNLGRSAADAVKAAGAAPVLLDSSGKTCPDLQGFDAALILGGGDVDPASYGSAGHPSITDSDPAADAFEAEIIRSMLATSRPVFGICRGMQLLNVVHGGTLIEDLGPDSFHRDHSPEDLMLSHDVQVVTGTRLAAAFGNPTESMVLEVQSSHHQAVRTLGEGLRVAAWASDGVIEAIESTGDAWVVGVQWHPEDAGTKPGQFPSLLAPFVAEAAKVAGMRGTCFLPGSPATA